MKSLLRATDVWKRRQLCGAPGDGVITFLHYCGLLHGGLLGKITTSNNP